MAAQTIEVSENDIATRAAELAAGWEKNARARHDNAERAKYDRDLKLRYVCQPFAGPYAADFMPEALEYARHEVERRAKNDAALAAADPELVEQLRQAEFQHLCADQIAHAERWKSARAITGARLDTLRKQIFGSMQAA